MVDYKCSLYATLYIYGEGWIHIADFDIHGHLFSTSVLGGHYACVEIEVCMVSM